MSTAFNYDELENMFVGGGAPAAKFETIGSSISGTIVSAEARQQTDFESGEKLTWSNGDPMMEVVLTLSTSLRDKSIEDDDGTRRLFVRGQMLTAMRQAVRNAKDTKPRIGGRITVTFSGEGEAKKRGYNKPKIYTVNYEAPNEVAVEEMFDEPAAAVDNSDVLDQIKDLSPEQLAALLAKK